jgi:hypothetical protein
LPLRGCGGLSPPSPIAPPSTRSGAISPEKEEEETDLAAQRGRVVGQEEVEELELLELDVVVVVVFSGEEEEEDLVGRGVETNETYLTDRLPFYNLLTAAAVAFTATNVYGFNTSNEYSP